MTDVEKVIRVVRKLLAKADNAATTPEESAAFAAKANQLLLEHKLGLTDVQLVKENAAEPIGKHFVSGWRVANIKKRAAWLEELADTIAYVNFCRLILHPPYSSITFVGKTSDRDLAVFLFEKLAKEAYSQGKTWANQQARYHQKRGERVPYKMLQGYLEGFVGIVNQRLMENYQNTRTQGGKFALVLFKSERERVNDWYKDNGPKSTAKEISRDMPDFRSMMAGAQAGAKAALHGGLQEPDTVNAAQLGKGKL